MKAFAQLRNAVVVRTGTDRRLVKRFARPCVEDRQLARIAIDDLDSSMTSGLDVAASLALLGRRAYAETRRAEHDCSDSADPTET